jgi:uncharacterized protein (DUF433 family)
MEYYDSEGELMPAVQTSIRIRSEAFKEIKRLSTETGKEFSVITNELPIEAIKMRRCPGITFVDGVTGRRARIAGTGLEVWEIISAYNGFRKNWTNLKSAYDWLPENQLKAALNYYIRFSIYSLPNELLSYIRELGQSACPEINI